VPPQQMLREKSGTTSYVSYGRSTSAPDVIVQAQSATTTAGGGGGAGGSGSGGGASGAAAISIPAGLGHFFESWPRHYLLPYSNSHKHYCIEDCEGQWRSFQNERIFVSQGCPLL